MAAQVSDDDEDDRDSPVASKGKMKSMALAELLAMADSSDEEPPTSISSAARPTQDSKAAKVGEDDSSSKKATSATAAAAAATAAGAGATASSASPSAAQKQQQAITQQHHQQQQQQQQPPAQRRRSPSVSSSASSTAAAGQPERRRKAEEPVRPDAAGEGDTSQPSGQLPTPGQSHQPGFLEAESYAASPWSWSAEHEKKLLLNNVEEPQNVLSSKTSAPSLASLGLVEVHQCTELRRQLAQEYGLPTCVFAHSKFIGVGTLRGVVVLLDPQLQDAQSQPQALCPPGSEETFAVTAGAFAPDSSSVIVGHKNGQVVLWDLNTKRVAVTVKDVHTTPVGSIVFCRSSWQYALSADAAGNVLLLTFTSTLGRRACQATMLLGQSSNIGVTLRILPLPQLPLPGSSASDSLCLVAICATNATVLLTLHPSVQVLQKLQYNKKDAAPSCVPDAAWMRVTANDSMADTILQQPQQQQQQQHQHTAQQQQQHQQFQPLLCIVHGQIVHLMRVAFGKEASSKDDFKISLVRKYRWGSPIMSVVALNDSVLALLDNDKKLTIVQLPPNANSEATGLASGDPSQQPQQLQQQQQQLLSVHTEDVSGLSLVYHLNTSLDGNKDARSHQGALAVFQGKSRTLYACGIKQVWALQVQRWGNKVEELVNSNEWSKSLELFLGLRRGHLPPLLDFPYDMAARQRSVDSRTTQVVQSYLVKRLQADVPRAEAREIAGCAVFACIEMGLWSVLYKTVFECFKNVGHVNIYCSTLEPYLVNGRIPRNQMDSEVLSSILQSYMLPLEQESIQAEQRFQGVPQEAQPLLIDSDHCPELFPSARRLQQLCFYVEVPQLDLNLAIRQFVQHRLWTGLVHIYCALGDYTAPLELLVGECMQVAKRCHNRSTPSPWPEERPLLDCLLVRKLFFFLHRTLEMRCFPVDLKDIAGLPHPSPKGIMNLLKCTLQPESPIFEKLLRISPVGVFNSFASLFTSPSANRALANQASQDGPPVLGDAYHPLTLSKLYRAIEDAYERARRRGAQEGQPLPPHADREFLYFTARVAPRAQLGLPISVSLKVVENLLASDKQSGLAFGGRSKQFTEELLIRFLQCEDPFRDANERDRFAQRLASLGFYGTASWIYEQHGDMGQALDCRLKDSQLREEIFEYIITRLAEGNTSSSSSSRRNAERLSGNNEKENSNNSNNREASPTAVTDVMKGQEMGCLTEEEPTADPSAALVTATLERLIDLVELDAARCAVMICEQFSDVADHSSVLQRLRRYPQMELQYLETLLVRRKLGNWMDSESQQRFFDGHVIRYVELLCTHNPSAVLPFITENEALPLGECLDLCRRFDVTDASIYLLEKTGDFTLVLKLLLGDYQEELTKFKGTCLEPGSLRTALRTALKRLQAQEALLTTAAASAPAQTSPLPSTSAATTTSTATATQQQQQQQQQQQSTEPPWYEEVPTAKRCVDLVKQSFEMSSRNSNIMMEGQLEQLWFGILEQTIRRSEEASSFPESKGRKMWDLALSDLTQRCMTGVLTFLSLPRTLKWVCDTFGESRLTLWRGPIKELFAGLDFQVQLLSAARCVAAKDVVKPFVALKVCGSRGVGLAPGQLAEAVLKQHATSAGDQPKEVAGGVRSTPRVRFFPTEAGEEEDSALTGSFKVKLVTSSSFPGKSQKSKRGSSFPAVLSSSSPAQGASLVSPSAGPSVPALAAPKPSRRSGGGVAAFSEWSLKAAAAATTSGLAVGTSLGGAAVGAATAALAAGSSSAAGLASSAQSGFGFGAHSSGSTGAGSAPNSARGNTATSAYGAAVNSVSAVAAAAASAASGRRSQPQ